jgi:DNA-binding NarL/FixJ family response regulator
MLNGTEFTVAGEASSGKEALEVAREIRPDLALLDIRMAGGDGIEALLALKKVHPEMIVLMLTTYENPTFMARAVAGGAAGYLLKGIERQELLDAMRAVTRGEMLLTGQELTRSLRGISKETAQSCIEPLSEREVEVLRLLATGISNREIASLLFIAESTVKTHIEHIISKLGVSDRVQAAVWAAREGLLEKREGQE